MIQKERRSALCQGKNDLTADRLISPVPGSATVCSSSSAPSGGWRWMSDSHRTLLLWGAPGIWMTSLSPVDKYKLWTALLKPPVTHPPLAAFFYCLCPAQREPWWGGSSLYPTMEKICYKQSIRVEGCSLCLEWLLCPTRDIAKSKYI